jgi:hypothetical protein
MMTNRVYHSHQHNRPLLRLPKLNKSQQCMDKIFREVSWLESQDLVGSDFMKYALNLVCDHCKFLSRQILGLISLKPKL